MKKSAEKAVFILLLAAFFACGTIMGGIDREDKAPAAAKSLETASSDGEYTVTLYEGDIYVYRISEGERFLVKKKSSVSPRREDIAMLAEGITVSTLAEALMLFEDFTS